MVSKAGLLFAVVAIVVVMVLESLVLPRLLSETHPTRPGEPARALVGWAFLVWVTLVATASGAALSLWPRHGSGHDETLCIIGYAAGLLVWLGRKAGWLDEQPSLPDAGGSTLATGIGLVIGGVVFVWFRMV